MNTFQSFSLFKYKYIMILDKGKYVDLDINVILYSKDKQPINPISHHRIDNLKKFKKKRTAPFDSATIIFIPYFKFVFILAFKLLEQNLRTKSLDYIT